MYDDIVQKLEVESPLSLTSDKIEFLRTHSNHFRLYHRIYFEELCKLLDLHESTYMSGEDAANLLGSASKQMIGVYAMGGNYNLVIATVFDLIERLTKNPEMLAIIRYNTNVELEATGNFLPADKAMENFGIAITKQEVEAPRADTFKTSAEQLNSIHGAISFFVSNCDAEY
jgi:hypothetical protein